MKRLLLVIALLLLCSTASASSLIYSQDFESADWADDFTGVGSWSDNITRTTNDPNNGTYAIRWNQDATRVDPITSLQGIGNSVFDWRRGVANWHMESYIFTGEQLLF